MELDSGSFPEFRRWRPVGNKSQLKNSSVYTSYVRQTISRGARWIEVSWAKFRPPRPTHTRTPDRNPPKPPSSSGARAVAGACLGHLPSACPEGKWAKNRTMEVPRSPAHGRFWPFTVRRTLCKTLDPRTAPPSPVPPEVTARGPFWSLCWAGDRRQNKAHHDGRSPPPALSEVPGVQNQFRYARV